VSDTPVIAVIDDDQAIREALEDLLVSLGYRAVLFASAEDFLAFPGRSTGEHQNLWGDVASAAEGR
jgi:FixJ family two-component response regulator